MHPYIIINVVQMLLALSPLQQVPDENIMERLRNLGATCFPTTVDATKPGARRTIVDISVGESWTGGDTGLQLVRDLMVVRKLYLIGNPKISDTALEKLRREMPSLKVVRIGRAHIGISVVEHDKGMRIIETLEDSPAERAGILQGDILVRLEGVPTPDADSIWAILATKKVGDAIEIETIRDGNLLKVKLLLGERKDNAGR